MTRLLIAVLCMHLFYYSCKKPDFNDVGGTTTLSGVVLLRDNYASTGRYTPVANLTVYLRNQGDMNAYLYSTKTDSQGQFSFSGVDSTRSYRIDATHELDQVKYTGSAEIGPNSNRFKERRDTLLLTINENLQNGVHITVKDYLGGAVPNATVWVFSSPAGFAADTSANATFTLQTDAFGVVNKYQLASGDYYFRVKTRAGNTELVDETKVTVGPQGIQPVSLVVQPTPRPGFGNGIDIMVNDKNGMPVPNATVFLYKNYDTYIQDSGKLQNSLFKLTSGSNGHANAYIINPATYFLWSRKIVSAKDTLSSREQKVIEVKTSIVSDTVVVK